MGPVRILRRSLRDGLFSVFRRVLETDDGRAMVTASARGLLNGRPTRFTVRPEKIHLLAEDAEPEAGAHVEDGRIRDVVYVGMITRYVVDLDDGGALMVVRQNLETSSSDVLEARDRRVRLAWRPEHTYAIESGGETEEETDD